MARGDSSTKLAWCGPELWIVAGVVALAGAPAAALALTRALSAGWAAIGAGALLTAIGLAVGVPAGIAYHVRLAQALGPERPPRWWWDPTSLHGRLPASRRAAVLRTFWIGAIACGACFVGCGLVVVGLMWSIA